jgi:hypothetical protein
LGSKRAVQCALEDNAPLELPPRGSGGAGRLHEKLTSRGRTAVGSDDCLLGCLGTVGKQLAELTIWLWLPITFYLFKRYPAQRAALYAFFAGMLLLPNWVGFKLPLFPEVDKATVTGLAITLVLLISRPSGVGDRIEPWFWPITIGLLASGFMTGFLNQDPIYFPASAFVLPGHTFKDSGAIALGWALAPATATYAGMRVFRRPEDVRQIVRVITGVGLLYTIPVLWELKMSPQIHGKVYGFTGSHEWAQLIRYGGYRPLVMFSHGLVLSLFMLLPTMTSMANARTGASIWKFKANTAAWYLTVVLAFCKSTGVWFYAAFALPMARWASSKSMLRLALALCMLTFAYPWARSSHIIPTTDIIAKVAESSAERAQSLEVRFTNEEILLAKAQLRPWFGWGNYGRNRVYDEAGVDICVTDGHWILAIGSLGLVGFFFLYCFGVLPLLTAARRIAQVRDTTLRNQMAVLVFACSLLWVDNLLNAPDFLIVQFIGGALCSISRSVLNEQDRVPSRQKTSPTESPRRSPVAARAS